MENLEIIKEQEVLGKCLKFDELKIGEEYYVLGKSKIIEFGNHSLSQDIIVKFEDGTYLYKNDLKNGTFELYKHNPNGEK